MGFFTFLKEQMSENGAPSNNRVMLFMLLTTTMLLIIAATIGPIWKITITLPVIPDSFASLVEWISTVLVSGVAIGKGINAVRDVKGAGNAGTNDGQGSQG